jgi:tRNA nucleotidyltransferase (CCA-adding enzyme)
MDWFLERARELGVDRSPPKPLLLGRHLLDLGVPPGPAMGELLKQVYERQLDGEITSTDDAIKLASQMVGISPQRHKDAE